MRRRQFLAAAAATPGFAAVGRGSHPTSTADDAADRESSADPMAETALQPLGFVPVDGIKEAVVGADGETAYAATGNGFATVDLADPADPAVLADRRDLLADDPDGPLEGIHDVKVEGDRLVVVGPAHPTDPLRAALFYDVSDPADPQRLGVYETAYPIHNCDVADGVAYLTANGRRGNRLVAVSIGSEPERLGSWSIIDEDEGWLNVPPILWVVHDVTVHDDRAYLAHWDAGTWVLDVSDPADPSPVNSLRGRPPADFAGLDRREALTEAQQLPGNDHYAAVNDDATLLGVGLEAWGDPGPGGIELRDVSNGGGPQRRATIDAPDTPDPGRGGVWTTAHNFEFAGDRLYTSWYRGGVRVFDVSDPSDPVELAAWRDDGEASFWTARAAGEFFVGASGHSENADLPDRLYTFPDPGGPLAGGGTPAGDPTTDGNESAAATGTGFGTLAALAGLAGAGAGLAARRLRE